MRSFRDIGNRHAKEELVANYVVPAIIVLLLVGLAFMWAARKRMKPEALNQGVRFTPVFRQRDWYERGGYAMVLTGMFCMSAAMVLTLVKLLLL